MPGDASHALPVKQRQSEFENRLLKYRDAMQRMRILGLALLAACGSGTASSDLPDSSVPSGSDSEVESEVSFADVRREGCTSSTTTKVVSESVTATADGVEFSTSSPLQLELEDAIRVEVAVNNTTDQAKTIELTELEFDWVTPPPDPARRWYMQLYQMNSNRAEIAPGTTATFAWHIDPDGDLDERGEQPIMRPTFRVGAETASLDIRITSANVFGDLERMGLAADAVVYGLVTDTAGAPVANAEVTAFVFSLKERAAQTRTDAQGRFALCVPSSDTYETRVGNRTSAYQLATYLSVRTDSGYQFATLDVAGDSETRVDVKLDSATSRELAVVAESRLPTNHGWFWIHATPDGFAAVEGRHPPELRKSGSLALVGADGGLVLQATLGDECWGFDVSVFGDLAAGCHDGSITVWAADGTKKWSRSTMKSKASYARWVRFSPDGTKLLAGPLSDVAEMLDAETGKTLWGYTARPNDVSPLPEHLRNGLFTSDGSRVVLGLAGGWIASLDAATGDVQWEGSYMGEFPLAMELDDDGVLYAVGKSREVFAFGANGQVKWRVPIYEAVSTAAETALLDGYFIGHTVNGSIYAIDTAQGKLAWWRKLGNGDGFNEFVETSGHNSLDVDPVNGLIAHGEVIDRRDGGGSRVSIYTRSGTLLSTVYFADEREQAGETVGHQIRGVQSLAFDKSGRLGAAFGDGYLRIFEIR